MSRSRAAGHPVTLERVSSIADGLLAVRPGDVTFAHVQAFVDEVMTVTDDQIKAAVRWLFSEQVSSPNRAVLRPSPELWRAVQRQARAWRLFPAATLILLPTRVISRIF